MSFEIAKAGWLYRLSSILKRWKRAWFVLYTDGLLKYFENPDVHTAEDAVNIPQQCSSISCQVLGVQPPSGFSPSNLISLTFYDGDQWTLCADSIDDSKAWEISINEAKFINIRESNFGFSNMGNTDLPPPYSPNYQYGQPYISNAHACAPPLNQQQLGQQQTVIYVDRPVYYRRHDDGTDMAMGLMAGAAVGSMMWGPLLWW